MIKEYSFNMHMLEYRHKGIADGKDVNVYEHLRALKGKEVCVPRLKVARVFDFMYPAAKVWPEESIYRSLSGLYYFYTEGYSGVWYLLPEDFKVEDVFDILHRCIDDIPSKGYRNTALLHLEYCKGERDIDIGDMLRDIMEPYVWESATPEHCQFLIENSKKKFTKVCAILNNMQLSVVEAMDFDTLLKSEIGKKVQDIIFDDPDTYGLLDQFEEMRKIAIGKK